jgi:hypothetical protein
MVALSTLTVVGVSKSNTLKRVGSSGRIKAINVQVYGDSSCTDVIDEFDWGKLEPGDSVNKKIYVKHNSKFDHTLSVYDSGWNPIEAGSYLTLSCDKDGMILGPKKVVEAIITLTVSDEISGINNFSFNIVMEAVNQNP